MVEIRYEDMMNMFLFLFAGSLGIILGIALGLGDPGLAAAWQDTGWAACVILAFAYGILWYYKRQREQEEPGG